MSALSASELLAVEIYSEVFHIVDNPGDLNGNTASAIAGIAEKVTCLVLEDKPLMIAPRLLDDRKKNQETLMAAMSMGSQYILQMDGTYYFFATKNNLDARLRSLGLKDFGDPEQPTDRRIGPYGALRETNLHWHI